MAGLDDLLSQIPIADLAKKLGVDPNTASEAVQKALPALVGGMQANADSGGAPSLEKAVQSHSASLIEGGVNLDDVNTDDGKKIVKHVFGDSQDKVISTLSGDGATSTAGGGLGDVIGKVLPVLAPLVMSFLAQKATAQKPASGTAAAQDQGGIGGLLGGLLGGGNSGSGGGGLGDILGGLGGLLGGGRK